ncbi:MAG: hypothetical protein GX855_03490 [Firmicutes bacterium]|nr:hypothetical protein [Bacillota bacterium]
MVIDNRMTAKKPPTYFAAQLTGASLRGLESAAPSTEASQN